MGFWAYMLHYADDSYYVGHTDDLEQRMGAHHAATLGGYTATRRPLALMWSQEFVTREEALAAERQIKGWNRAKKTALIRGDWKEIQRQAWGTRNPLPEHLRGRVHPSMTTGHSILRYRRIRANGFIGGRTKFVIRWCEDNASQKPKSPPPRSP